MDQIDACAKTEIKPHIRGANMKEEDYACNKFVLLVRGGKKMRAKFVFNLNVYII